MWTRWARCAGATGPAGVGVDMTVYWWPGVTPGKYYLKHPDSVYAHTHTPIRRHARTASARHCPGLLLLCVCVFCCRTALYPTATPDAIIHNDLTQVIPLNCTGDGDDGDDVVGYADEVTRCGHVAETVGRAYGWRKCGIKFSRVRVVEEREREYIELILVGSIERLWISGNSLEK